MTIHNVSSRDEDHCDCAISFKGFEEGVRAGHFEASRVEMILKKEETYGQTFLSGDFS